MSSYSCSYAECVTKKKTRNQDKEKTFIPFRLLVCGHSICDLCLLYICKQQKEFIKCTVCSFNTTFTEAVQKNVTQNEMEIKRWLDPNSVTAPEILRFDANLFPLDFYQIGFGVHSGVVTATKTAEMIDLDLDEDTPVVIQAPIPQSVVNSLFEDDSTVKSVITRIPRTAPERFQQSVQNGIKTFTDLSQNHTSIKRSSDDTKEWFKRIRTNGREMFHKMHSILQIREKELMEEIDVIEENRQQELRVFMNEILSTRSELKGKILQSPQLQTDRDRNVLRKAIDKIVSDSNVMSIQSPQKEFKFHFENSIESYLKKFGKVERQVAAVIQEADPQVNGTAQEVNKSTKPMEPINVSDDEEDEDVEITDISKEHQKIDKEVVTILQIGSPVKFYVQKSSDKERFDILNEEIHSICGSAYYHSPAWDTLKPGEQVFAYSLQKACWCRATLTFTRSEVNPHNREPIYLADIVLIDYGITETVNWYNIREKKVELFDNKKWPPFAYKCALHGIKPKKVGTTWNQTAIDLFKRYVNNVQLVLIDFGTKDGIKYVDLIHYDVPAVTYQIPSVIEALVKNEAVIPSDNIDFASYCRYKCQPLKYPIPETPKTLKTLSVLVSHVESPDLFYVQLQRQHQSMIKLVNDLNTSYSDENAGIYTYYCPKVNTPCAALFVGDKKYYRALILQKGKNMTEFLVQFIDFGNKEIIQNKDLRLLKDSFVKDLPIQAIPCGLIHVDPAFGFKWSSNATDGFKYAISNDRGPQILTMCVYETKQFDQNMPKLLVVLRSYDGDSGIKINEQIVKQKLAISTGIHSQPDFNKMLSASQDSLNSMSSSSSISTVKSKTVIPFKVSAFSVIRDLVERFESSKADKRSSLIKVCVCFVDSPSLFYIQIERPEVRDYFENQEKELHKAYSSAANRFTGDIQFQENELCAFIVNSCWRRGQVVRRIEQLSDAAPEEPRYSVIDMDYGSEKEVRVSVMRRLSEEFAKDGAFSLKCKLYGLRPTGGNQWSNSSKDEFSDFIAKYGKDLSILVKGSVETEPISVKLYSRQSIIPGAFAQQKIVYESINHIFIEKGLATYDWSGGLVSSTESDDDKDINTETPREKTQMPFSMYSSTESVLGSLQQRLNNDTNPHKYGEYFQYLKEEYPKEQTFYGLGTDLTTHPKEYNISFRFWWEGAPNQPTQVIEKKIQDLLNERGELEPFVGPYTTGAACTAYFDFDKTWNRAEIIGVTESEGNNKMCVRFVDYGNQESMLVDKLSSEVFSKDTPKLALKCQLVNIKPINEESHTQIKNLIYTRVLDNKCRFYWENYPKLPMKVTVEILEGEDYIPFIQFLERQHLLALRHEDNEAVDDIMNTNPMIDRVYGLYPIVFQSDRFYEVVMSYYIGANYAFFQATELRYPNAREDVINSEHDHFLEMLEKLRDEVNTYPLLRNIREGYQCVAKYVDDCWYRGLIISVDDTKHTAQVFFVDHGNDDPIPFGNLREIPKKYLKPKAHAFLCQISNIKPPNDQTWSRCTELADKLMGRLSDISSEEKMFARFKNTEYPLKIDCYRSDANDRTKPGKHVFQDFVDKGLLEFSDLRDVWRKPIETTHSYKSMQNTSPHIKSERID